MKVCLLEDPIVVDFLADLVAALSDIWFLDDEKVPLVVTLLEMDCWFLLLLDLFFDDELRRDAVVILLFFLFIGQVDK